LNDIGLFKIRACPKGKKVFIEQVIVRLDRTIQNLFKRLDSPIKSGNDSPLKFSIVIETIIQITDYELRMTNGNKIVRNASEVSKKYKGGNHKRKKIIFIF
jgi:hypothetical protein